MLLQVLAMASELCLHKDQVVLLPESPDCEEGIQFEVHAHANH